MCYKVYKLEKQLNKIKTADCKTDCKSKKLVKILMARLHALNSQPVGAHQLAEHSENPSHPHHPHHPHHRTVRIHSETETKSELFSQHQTRDVSMSLESGDSLSPAELAKQMQALQSSIGETQAEKEALIQQVSLLTGHVSLNTRP